MSDADPQRRSRGAELILPVAALAFTLYYFSTIWDSPWTAQVAAFFVGAILIGLILIFIGQVLLQRARGEADLGMHDILQPVSFLPTRMGLIGLTILFAVAIDWGGFTLTAFAFMALSMMMLNRGRQKALAVLLAACFAISGYLLFIVAFGIRFPEGPFEHLMKGLF